VQLSVKYPFVDTRLINFVVIAWKYQNNLHKEKHIKLIVKGNAQLLNNGMLKIGPANLNEASTFDLYNH